MQPDHLSHELPSLAQYIPLRFQALIWSCLESELVKSAVFYAERYYALDPQDHDARHLYATSLLRCDQVHSAMHLVNLATDSRCSGCSEIKSKCCSALGRHRQAREALEDSLGDIAYLASGKWYSTLFLPSSYPLSQHQRAQEKPGYFLRTLCYTVGRDQQH